MFLFVDFRKIKKYLKFILILILAAAFFIWCVRKYFPVKHLDIIERYSIEYGLAKELVCAVIRAESSFNPMAVSPKGARGLMQIMKQTGDWAADEIGIENYDYDRIFEPEINIRIGTWYLNRLINQYNSNKQTALAAYNAGSGNVSKWLEVQNTTHSNLDSIPFPETREYLRRIQKFEKIYAILLMFYL